MTYKFLAITALRSLSKHKTRSILTTLGIIVGVVAIISVMSIGQGAKTKVRQHIKRLGTNFIIIFGTSPKRMAATRGQGFGNQTLKKIDLNSIQNECSEIKAIAPLIVRQVKAVYEGSNWQTLIGGTNEKLLEVKNLKMFKGQNFTQHDIKTKSKVVILGKTVARELFGTENPVGKKIRIKNLPFTVLGVIGDQGKTPDGRDQDDAIFAPITTVQKKLFGTKNNNFSILMLSTKTEESMGQVATEIRSILRQNHNLKETDDDDFTLFTQDDMAQATDAASQVLNLLLIIIASISLIVGGIGIMNIMMVTVAERTKEIGIRMALGATSKNIQNQFILEAIIICGIGGTIGIIIGIIVSFAIGIGFGWPIFISTKSIFTSLLSSTAIGLFFGFYPAYQASQLNPVEALFER